MPGSLEIFCETMQRDLKGNSLVSATRSCMLELDYKASHEEILLANELYMTADYHTVKHTPRENNEICENNHEQNAKTIFRLTLRCP